MSHVENTENIWKMGLWSDEIKIGLVALNAEHYIRWKTNANITASLVKHGGYILLSAEREAGKS